MQSVHSQSVCITSRDRYCCCRLTFIFILCTIQTLAPMKVFNRILHLYSFYNFNSSTNEKLQNKNFSTNKNLDRKLFQIKSRLFTGSAVRICIVFSVIFHLLALYIANSKLILPQLQFCSVS